MEEKWSLNLLILQSLLIDGHICILHSFEMVTVLRIGNPPAIKIEIYLNFSYLNGEFTRYEANLIILIQNKHNINVRMFSFGFLEIKTGVLSKLFYSYVHVYTCIENKSYWCPIYYILYTITSTSTVVSYLIYFIFNKWNIQHDYFILYNMTT